MANWRNLVFETICMVNRAVYPFDDVRHILPGCQIAVIPRWRRRSLIRSQPFPITSPTDLPPARRNRYELLARPER